MNCKIGMDFQLVASGPMFTWPGLSRHREAQYFNRKFPKPSGKGVGFSVICQPYCFLNRSLWDFGVVWVCYLSQFVGKKAICCLKFRFVSKLSLLFITYEKAFWFCCTELHAKQNWVVFGFNIRARADNAENKKHSPVVQDILIWLCSLENLFSLILVWLSAGFPWSRRLKLIQDPKLFSSVLTKPRIQSSCVNTLWLSWIFKPHFAVWPKMEGGLQWETHGWEWNFKLGRRKKEEEEDRDWEEKSRGK